MNDRAGREPELAQLVVVTTDQVTEEVDQFEVFYQAQWSRLVAVCRPLVASSAIAEELAQEALFAAHRRWASVSQLERPDFWVRRVAMNLATSQWRRRLIESRVNRLHHASESRVSADVPAADDELWAAVSRLPDRQRTALALHYVDRLTTAEIAKVLGCTASTVESHLARARDALRHSLRQRTQDTRRTSRD